MAKPSRGATRFAAGKKKAKKRYEPQSASSMQASTMAQEPVHEEPTGPVQRSSGPVLQFRPREATAARSTVAKGGSAARAMLQAVDYSYVYTDLKLIGGLTVLLFGGLVALSFAIH